ERLLDQGHELEVWNRSPGRAAPFEHPARVLETPDAVNAEAVVPSLADDASVTAVGRPDGRARGAWGDRLVVNTATVAPTTERELAEVYGGRFVPTPILGACRHFLEHAGPTSTQRYDPVLNCTTARGTVLLDVFSEEARMWCMTSHTVRLVLRSGVILEQMLNETDFRELEDQFVARVRAHSQERLLVFGDGFCLVNIDEVAALTWGEGNDAIVSPTPGSAPTR
ncbi:MAG TPA: hypothetical protein VGH76_05210, partial [Actinomycetospora sp.]